MLRAPRNKLQCNSMAELNKWRLVCASICWFLSLFFFVALRFAQVSSDFPISLGFHHPRLFPASFVNLPALRPCEHNTRAGRPRSQQRGPRRCKCQENVFFDGYYKVKRRGYGIRRFTVRKGIRQRVEPEWGTEPIQ